MEELKAIIPYAKDVGYFMLCCYLIYKDSADRAADRELLKYILDNKGPK